MSTVYVTIGNTDDKLAQETWAKFYSMTDQYVRRYADEVYGAWISESSSQYQNACWGIDLTGTEKKDKLKAELAWVASLYHQDTIAWADCAETEMIKASDETY